MEQTKVTEANRAAFYKTLYPQQLDCQEKLIQLTHQTIGQYIVIDSCSWHYKACWPNANIIGLECLSTALEFKLQTHQFDKLIDTRQPDNIAWPNLNTNNPALIFDRSPILKYKTVSEIVNIVVSAADKYQANAVFLNIQSVFVDDIRLTDRFNNLINLQLPNFIVKKFYYDENIYAVYDKKVAI